MTSVPESFHDLFERSLVAHFTTLMPDGTPYPRPVWIDYDADADRVVVNSGLDRQKAQNAARNEKVGVSIVDPSEVYRFVSVRGRVEEITEEGAERHIDELARQYMGVEEWPDHSEDVTRVKIRIRPEDVVTSDSTGNTS
jgi:PPOX class probable F420-dependent enzyme